jgi:hypothetical protein
MACQFAPFEASGDRRDEGTGGSRKNAKLERSRNGAFSRFAAAFGRPPLV